MLYLGRLIRYDGGMFFDSSIASAKELSQALDDALAVVLAMDSDEPSADDFAHIQGLFRGFTENAKAIVIEYIATLENYERVARQFVELEQTAAANTAETQRITASLRH